jgi:uncharacterized protein YdeI (YjbR/CyaY-like superfamily)
MRAMIPYVSDAVFFATPAAFREWLAAHAATEPELLVGYWKVVTGRPSMTWAESVDEALCYGWIDGIRRSLGDEAYTIRFTPRRAGSRWSAVNVRRVPELVAEGRMTPAGLAVYEARRDAVGYSYGADAALSPEQEAALRAVPGAWEFWERQPPGYRRTVAHWIANAKRADTRERRLATLVADCAAGRRLARLIPPGRRPDVSSPDGP